ncbi:MAG: ribosome silencing factor [Acutalibacteraceae bacterium]|nr:ribosome silencing factor [Acutalibacteraceae bacterium]
MTTNEILKIAVNALDSKKAVDIYAVEVGDLTVLTDYFIIVNGTSSTHVKALADEVEDKLSKSGLEPDNIEGKSSGWILLDYGTVVVHVFTKEARDYYNIERLWSDGKIIDINVLINEED